MNYAAVANLTLPAFLARVHVAWGMVAGTRLNQTVRDRGYVNGFFPEQVRPTLDKGWTSTLFHRPHGDDAAATGEPMNEDAPVENRDPGALDYDDMLRAGLHSDPAWVNITYGGSKYDPDYGRQTSRGLWSAWRNRQNLAWARMGLDCPNNSLAFDHSATLCADYEVQQPGGQVAGFPLGYWRAAWAEIESLAAIKRLQGRTVWLEALPFRYATHQHAHNFVCRTFLTRANEVQSEWARSRPQDDILGSPFVGNEWAAPSQAIRGHVLDWNVILGRHPLDDYARAIADVLARGDRFHWAGAVFYLPESAEQVWRAVTAYASSIASVSPPTE